MNSTYFISRIYQGLSYCYMLKGGDGELDLSKHNYCLYVLCLYTIHKNR